MSAREELAKILSSVPRADREIILDRLDELERWREWGHRLNTTPAKTADDIDQHLRHDIEIQSINFRARALIPTADERSAAWIERMRGIAPEVPPEGLGSDGYLWLVVLERIAQEGPTKAVVALLNLALDSDHRTLSAALHALNVRLHR